MTKKGMKWLVNSGACVGVLAWLIYLWGSVLIPLEDPAPRSIIEWIFGGILCLIATALSCVIVYGISVGCIYLILLFCNFCGFLEDPLNYLYDDDETYTDNKNDGSDK